MTGVLAIAIAMIVGATSRPVIAAAPSSAPASQPEEPSGPTPQTEPSPASAEAPADIDAALEAGDLSTAASLAEAQRKADPSPANWRTEAAIAERRGDLQNAEAAYRGLLDALPAGATAEREQAAADLKRVRAQSRGTVAGEPKSTHRDDLDRKWSAGAKAPKKTPRAVLPPPSRRGDDRIVTKWYFWVTVGAIVASAAAVTGIAIRAARDDEPDALGLSPEPRPLGPSLLRF